MYVLRKIEPLVSDTKTTSANAVTAPRWESLKREYFWRTHRNLPATAEAATVADPNAE